ncbi:DUF3466 family protein [Paraglaciecola aestuariivivens]
MIKTRLAAALSIAFIITPVSQAAKYRVVELPVTELGANSFSSAINANNELVVNVKTPNNVPIDLSLLDFDSDTLINGLTDIDSARVGNFNDDDYEFILAYIRAGDGSNRVQQVANTLSYLHSATSLDYIAGFDSFSEADNQYTLSTNTNARDINDAGLVVGKGEGAYSNFDYTDENGDNITYVLHEYGSRAFVYNGSQNIELPAPNTDAGGYSEAFAINANNQVVGYGSVDVINSSIATAEENCADDEARGDIPVEACLSNIVTSYNGAPNTYARLRGLIWQLDDSGNLISTKELGLLFEPDADSTANYSNQAVGINDHGIAVGSSNGEYTEGDVTVTRNYAVIYDNDTVINITPEPDQAVARSSSIISAAIDINNDNLVTGYQVKKVNGVNRNKFFVYDMNSQEITFPEDYFLGSSSVPMDINNQGVVVGFGEVDASLTGRRKEGFLYDHNSGEFTGIRNLLSCDTPYTIVQANAINDQGVIAATALYQGPKRNSRGEIFLDSDGNQVIVDIVTAVKLEPIAGGEIEDCTSAEDDINRERQGASVSWILGLGLVLLFTRRFKAKLA